MNYLTKTQAQENAERIARRARAGAISPQPNTMKLKPLFAIFAALTVSLATAQEVAPIIPEKTQAQADLEQLDFGL